MQRLCREAGPNDKQVMRYFFAGVFLFSMMYCSSSGEKKADVTASKPAVHPGCYMMVIGKDSALLNLQLQHDSVWGSLVYNRFEKDDNLGTFTGKIMDNKIVAWYDYESEGKRSMRQVILKIGDKKFFEGYGEITGSADSAVFRFPQALRYEENHPYLNIPCNEAAG